MFGPFGSDVEVNDADYIFDHSAGSVGTGSMTKAGDFNNDGYPDFVVGSRTDSSGGTWAGSASLMYGPVTEDMSVNEDYDFRVSERGSYNYFSDPLYGEMTVRDMDGDGNDDLIVSTAYHDTPSSNAGAAFVYYGPMDGDTQLNNFDDGYVTTSSFQYLGRNHTVNDFDNDGTLDMAVGAYGAATYRGVVYLWLQ